LLVLAGCEDRLVYDVRIRHGVAVIEERAENVWRDGIDCVGAEQCAYVLEQQRVTNRADVITSGGAVLAVGYAIRGDELDFVLRFTQPVDTLAQIGPLSPILLQRHSDERAGRAGVPSIAVIRDAGSAITVEIHGPSLRMSGGSSLFAGGSDSDTSLTIRPERVVDMLTRGRGSVHVVVPAVDEHGSLVHGEPWLHSEPGLAELLKARGMLVE
jgi:hypothetical protein